MRGGGGGGVGWTRDRLLCEGRNTSTTDIMWMSVANNHKYYNMNESSFQTKYMYSSSLLGDHLS